MIDLLSTLVVAVSNSPGYIILGVAGASLMTVGAIAHVSQARAARRGEDGVHRVALSHLLVRPADDELDVQLKDAQASLHAALEQFPDAFEAAIEQIVERRVAARHSASAHLAPAAA